MRAQDLIYTPGDDQEGVEAGVVEQIEDVYDEYAAFDGLIEYQDNEYTDHDLSEDYANDRGGPRRRRRPHGTRTRDGHPGTRYGPNKKPSYHKPKPKPSVGRPKPAYGPPKKKRRPSYQKHKPTYKKTPSYKPRPSYRPKPHYKPKHKPIYKPEPKPGHKLNYKPKPKPSYKPKPKPGYSSAPTTPQQATYDQDE